MLQEELILIPIINTIMMCTHKSFRSTFHISLFF